MITRLGSARHSWTWALLACMCLGTPPVEALGRSPRASTPIAAPKATSACTVLPALPLSFEPNVGQTDERVRYLARGNGGTAFLTDDGLVLALPAGVREEGHPGADSLAPESRGRDVLRMRFFGTGATRRIAGERELPGKVNHLRGQDRSKWRRNVPTFAAVRYANLYDGIDAVFDGADGRLEYDFVVAPGADPDQISVCFEGQQRIEVDEDGELTLSMTGGDVRQYRAQVYQEGRRGLEPVGVRTTLRGTAEVKFELGAYDETRPLVIDPILTYVAYLGGGGAYDAARGIAVDSGDAVYVAGETDADDFPVTDGTVFPTASSGRDAFVTKFAPGGASIAYSTYLGGSGEDVANGIAVDAAGRAYVTGTTNSADFPTTPGSFDRSYHGGAHDAFVVAVSADGVSLAYSTYVGGSGDDVANAIALDGTAAAYVAGSTSSNDLPVTAGAFDVTSNGGTDVFVVKLLASGASLGYASYVGGAQDDVGKAIAVTSDGRACVTGQTLSSGFPTTPGAYWTSNSELSQTVFVMKLDGAGASLEFSTFVRGAASPIAWCFGIAFGPTGDPYIVGYTQSGSYPTTPGAFDRTFDGSADVFVTRLDASGSALVYSTYLGGSSSEFGWGIRVDASGAAHLVGNTASADFPTTGGASDVTLDGTGDGFVAALAPNGAELEYSTFLGGRSTDGVNAIAGDTVGGDWVAGGTSSPDFPVLGQPLPAPSDASNAFVTRVAPGGGSLSFSAVLGGSVGTGSGDTLDVVFAVATDASGALYAAGYTTAQNFPTTTGAFDRDAEGYDAFVTKVSADGSSLVYSTLVGGSGADLCYGLAVNPLGEAYITGSSASPDFPTTQGVFDITASGDAFVTRLTPDGSSLVFSTGLGDDRYDVGNGICLGAEGSIYVAGWALAATYDAFARKLTADGSALVYDAVLQGSNGDYAVAVAVDATGAAYVTGYTLSTNFPTTPGAFDTTHNGSEDAFLVKLAPDGASRVYATLLGGQNADRGDAIRVDATGAAYVTGSTFSATFPSTPGAYQTANTGGAAFVTKLAPSGGSLVFSTFVGGSLQESGSGIALGPTGSVFIGGSTQSGNFPTTSDAYDASYNGAWDAFVAELSGDGSSLLYSTYLGGSGDDYLHDIALDATGDVCAGGITYSVDFPGTGFGLRDGISGLVLRLRKSRNTSTPGIYVPGTGAWFLRNVNAAGPADVVFTYGGGGPLVPLTGDWDGDGLDTPGVYDRSSGFFFLKNSNSPGEAQLLFGFGVGGVGWTPLAGDWNGDGVDTVGLYNPSNGFFFLRNVNAPGPADLVFGFGPGGTGWTPLVGDWDGDGRDTVGLYTPADGFFFLRNLNEPGPADLVFGFGPGGSGWTPLAGDWNGDGMDTVGLYAPSNGFFFLKNTNTPGPADLTFSYGPPNATPLVGDWDGL